MLLKIYLGISVLVFVLFVLQNLSGFKRAKNKYGDELSRYVGQKDVAGFILSWLKIVIISFIPIYHILILIVLVFCTSKTNEKLDELVKSAIEKEKEENK